MLLFILGVVVFIVGLVISVALHELGHLTFAKIFGIKVSQYMIGFGRTLWSKTIRGTEYGIKPILLGGYISMAGMFPPGSKGAVEEKQSGLVSVLVQDTEVVRGEEAGAFYAAKPWKRIIVMFAGPFMNLVIGVVIAAVLITGFGTPAAMIGAVSACVPTSPTATNKCTSADPVSPASISGLKKGDLVVSLNGVSYPTPAITQSLLQHSAGKAATLVVKRDGKLRTISVTPVKVSRDAIDSSGVPITDSSGKPVVQKLGAVGVALGQQLVPLPITATFGAVGSEVNGILTVLGRFPAGIVGVWNSVFDGAARSPSSPVSVVGVGRAIGDIASTSDAPVKLRIYDILSLLGELNISLFVFNLIPLLPLDGGHIVGAVWEAIRRFFAKLFHRRDPGPVDLAKLMPLTVAVVTVLVAISALLIVADLVNPVSVG
ncbi:MAG: site-2 protease family protein [Galbitalea sp.]